VPSSWTEVRRLFAEAIELPPARRDELLGRACGADGALRAEVRALLDAHDALTTEDGGEREFLAPLDAARAVTLLDAGRAVGPYRVVRELGRGGMGVVYLAERADGEPGGRVALKLVKRGMDSDEIHRRFLAERRILARLGHPHIARLLDGGVTEEGQPWFALEYVDGVPITAHCDRRALSVPERLRLFRDVCGAVAHAHAEHVVHRDLKPSNVLVTADGAPKLLDFGIAKVLRVGSAEAGEETLTPLGARVLTPEYAAPEQVRGDPVTAATDVYALGALLYELLTGRRAHRFTRDAPEEVARIICAVDPAPPGVAADLDAVVLRALHKDPARRYPTVDALLAALDRCDAAGGARPGSALARARRALAGWRARWR
jgi:serine/threonine-protein kinase